MHCGQQVVRQEVAGKQAVQEERCHARRSDKQTVINPSGVVAWRIAPGSRVEIGRLSRDCPRA